MARAKTILSNGMIVVMTRAGRVLVTLSGSNSSLKG
jgi:hypothetical protein